MKVVETYIVWATTNNVSYYTKLHKCQGVHIYFLEALLIDKTYALVKIDLQKADKLINESQNLIK